MYKGVTEFERAQIQKQLKPKLDSLMPTYRFPFKLDKFYPIYF